MCPGRAFAEPQLNPESYSCREVLYCTMLLLFTHVDKLLPLNSAVPGLLPLYSV